MEVGPLSKTTPSFATTPPLLPDRLIGIADVAELLGVEVRHVRRLVHELRIPFIRWGHLLRFDPLKLAAWIDSHRPLCPLSVRNLPSPDPCSRAMKRSEEQKSEIQ